MKILKCVVYRIINLIDNKFYIGSTIHAHSREINHFTALRRDNHPNKHLQNAFNKHGEQNFRFEILECVEKECVDKIELREYIEQREQYHLDSLLFASQNNNNFFHQSGYNNRRIAASNLGIKRDEESRKRYSEAARRTRSNPELELKRKKCVHTQEHKDKLSVKYGRPVLQFDLQGNFINEFRSVAFCSKQTGILSVIHACLGNYTKADEYIFIYKEDHSKMTKQQFEHKLYLANNTYAGGSNAKVVNKLDPQTLQVIGTYKSANEAGRSLGLAGGGNIGTACLGKLKSAYGFKWQYATMN